MTTTFMGSSEPWETQTTRNFTAFDEVYLQRLRNGDDETAKHFNLYFRRLVRLKLWKKFDVLREDELVNDVMAAAMEKIMRGEPRDAAHLPGYICGICANMTKRELRPSASNERVEADFERIPDGTKTIEERLQESEKAKAVRKVLSGLGRRDREVLVDLFYHERKRDEICEKHGVTRDQLRMILFHARQRFQRDWEKQTS